MTRAKRVGLTALAVFGLLAAGMTWRYLTWGRPLAVVYKRVAITPAGHGTGRSVTYQRAVPAGGSPVAYTAVDTDGDGTIDLVLKQDSLVSFARPHANDPHARWLVVCLDGVPYSEMFGLWQQGYFREFFRPVPLISPFPSDSETALTDDFHTAPVPGYEHRYFDRQRNHLAGGTWVTVTGKNIPYIRRLDYDAPGIFKGLTYVLPLKSFWADLGRFRSRFLASRAKIFLAHIATSDSLYHIRPRAEMRQRLVEVDALLRELYFNSAGRLRITVFSDHGNSLVKNRGVPLRATLQAHGWRLTDSIQGPRDVAVPAYGLIAFMAVYCAPESRAPLATDLAQMEGTDLVVYRDAGGAIIENSQGRARLDWTPDGEAFRYRPLTADPLQFNAILAGLAQAGKVNAEGWVDDADLFTATAGHIYPDAAHRIQQWAVDHVLNPSDLMVSLKPGYYNGSGVFQDIVVMLSTHGALDRQQSDGFAMTTDRPLPGPMRSEELLPANLGELKDEAGRVPARKAKSAARP